jgi:putative membrane protein
MKKIIMLLLVAGITACNSGDRGGASGTAAGNSEMTDDTAVTTSSVDTTVSNFIHTAAITNSLEIESGQLAQQKARNAQVKDFARRMVEDHDNAIRQLEGLAEKKNIEMPMMVDSNTDWAGTESSGSKTKSDDESKYGSQSTPGRDLTGNDSPAGGDGNTGNSGRRSGSAADAATNNPMYTTHQEKLNRLRQRTGADFDREYMKMMVEDHEKAISLFERAAQNKDAEVKDFAAKMLPTLKKHQSDSKSLLASLK